MQLVLKVDNGSAKALPVWRQCAAQCAAQYSRAGSSFDLDQLQTLSACSVTGAWDPVDSSNVELQKAMVRLSGCAAIQTDLDARFMTIW